MPVRATLVAALLGWMALHTAAVAAPLVVDGPEAWRRVPHQVIPALPVAPTIDGVVDRAEWLAAAQLGPLKVGTEGVSDDLRREVFIGYDQKAVYLAFRLQRPAGAIEPQTPEKTGHLDSAHGGDMVELQFSPNLQFNKSYSFWLFPNSAYGEALLTRGKDPNWNGEWKQAARKTDTGWEGEAAIPFAAFGLSGPPPADQMWGFDFVDNRSTPFGLLAHWSYRGNLWHNYEYFGRVRFAAAPAVRFLGARETGDGKVAVEFEVANATAAAVEPRGVFTLLKRKEGAEGGPKSYYDNIESALSQDAQADFTKDTTLPGMIRFASGFYAPVADGEAARSLSVPAGERRTLGFTVPGAAGEYLLSYQVAAGDQTLAQGVTVFRVEPPLALKCEPYWLYSKLVDVTSDVHKLPLSGPGSVRFFITGDDASAAPLAETTVAVPAGARTVKASLPTGALKPGFYRVNAACLQGEGKAAKEIARNSATLQKPEIPAWFGTDWGNKIEVPEPWTPLLAEKSGQVSMWGRSYDLSKVLPSSALSQKDEVLAAPVEFQVQVAGKPLAWAVRKMELQSARPSKAVYNVELAAEGASIAGTMSVEFDGLIWYDLILTPARLPFKVEQAQLVIPISPSHSELMGHHKYLQDDVLSIQAPKPDKNGPSGVLTHSLIPFTPYLWIGDEKAGMGWICEAPMDWQITKPNSVLETVPAAAGQPAAILIHMIQAPTELKRPMRLQFGLQATPIRPIPDRHEILNIFQKSSVITDEKLYKQLADLGCKVFVFYYNWRGNSQTELGGTPERPPDPAQQEKLKAGVKLAHKYGLKVIMYTGWGINATSENWKKFGLELGAYPVDNHGWGAFTQSAGTNGGYADFMAYGHADLAKEYEVDGVLWDSTANLHFDRNLRTGNAWVDAEGRVRPKYPVLATREVYRRVYNIYHGEVRKDGVVYNHCGSMWPINVFADMQNRGEGRPMTAKTLRECWIPFEEFRTDYSAEPFGTLYSGEINDWAKFPMRVSTHLAVTLLHGDYAKEYSIYPKGWTYAYEGRPLIPLWKIFMWLPWDASTHKLFYYGNLKGKYQAVKATPASLLTSAFVSGDGKRAIVVVSNFDTTPVPGAVLELDAAALGMQPGALKVEDPILKKPLELQGNTLKLDVDQQRYRILKVSVP